jgi:undecaprenyl-diphosphatase
MAEALTTPRGRRLIAPRLRWFAGECIVAGVMVTLVLGLHFAHQSEPGRIDAALGNRLNWHFGEHRDVLAQLVHIGNPASIVIMSVVLAGLLALAGWWRAVVFALVAPVLAGAVTDFILKPLVDRRIGPDAALAFPSGHTTGAAAVAVVAAVVLLDPDRPALRLLVRIVLAAFALGVAIAVAFALVVLRYHYLTDVIGGVAVAVSVVLLVAFALDGLAERVLLSPRGRTDHPLLRSDRERQHL